MGWDWVHLERRPLFGLLYQTRMMMMIMGVEQSVEWELPGEIDIPGEKLSRLHFIHHKIPCHLMWNQTHASAVGVRQLTACWGTAAYWVIWHCLNNWVRYLYRYDNCEWCIEKDMNGTFCVLFRGVIGTFAWTNEGPITKILGQDVSSSGRDSVPNLNVRRRATSLQWSFRLDHKASAMLLYVYIRILERAHSERSNSGPAAGFLSSSDIKSKVKAIPVTGRGGL
jgi:hypothetical protein